MKVQEPVKYASPLTSDCPTTTGIGNVGNRPTGNSGRAGLASAAAGRVVINPPACPEMRLLTHNVMHNNTAAASAGSSLRITATEVRVDESTTDDDPEGQRREIEFAKHTLPILDWERLVEGARSMGLETLPPAVSPELANDAGFLRALYGVLMNVRLINGMLTCSETGKEFPVTDGIVNFMLEENECE